MKKLIVLCSILFIGACNEYSIWLYPNDKKDMMSSKEDMKNNDIVDMTREQYPHIGFCGDNVCSYNETCLTCPGDCNVCDFGVYVCGDGTCDIDENCSNCAVDCGECMPSPTPSPSFSPSPSPTLSPSPSPTPSPTCDSDCKKCHKKCSDECNSCNDNCENELVKCDSDCDNKRHDCEQKENGCDK